MPVMRFSLAGLLATGILANAASDAAPTSVQRVIALLTDLRNSISAEGDDEAKTYNNFACFCKDKIASKGSAVSQGEILKTSLQAQLNQAMGDREMEDSSITSEAAAAETLQGELVQLREQRRAEALAYAKNAIDLARASQGLDAAIRALIAARDATGLVQVRDLPSTVREALSLVDMLGPTPRPGSTSMMSLTNRRMNEDPLSEEASRTYEFHAGAVIYSLEELTSQFRFKTQELDAAETSVIHIFKSTEQTKERLMAGHIAAVEDAKKNEAVRTQEIATASQDLTTTSAQLLDDQAYLAELSTKCNEKALLWDARTQTRANELTAIAQAMELLQTGLSSNTTQAELQLIQKPPTLVQLTKSSHQLPRRLLLQIRGHGTPHPQQNSQQAQVADLLRTKAGELKSTLLLRLASQVAEDPFGKVKQMLQDLIERLLTEAGEEANHKGWCDQEVGLAAQARDKNAELIKEVNSQMEVGEARRAKLASLVEDLDGELRVLGADLRNSATLRGQERNESLAIVKAAKANKHVIAQALDILDRFYKTEAYEASGLSFIHIRSASGMKMNNAITSSSLEEDLPDAGFSGNYAGTQSANEGILGILQVIKSDFERTIAESENAETVAEQDFVELQTTLGESQAAKEAALLQRQAALRDADAEYADETDKLVAYQKGLDQALAQLSALHNSCLASGGMTAQERKIQRDEEIDALKQALCILEQHDLSEIAC